MAREVLHTPIHLQCAACSQLFRPGETLVALIYRNSSLKIYKNVLFTSLGQCCEQQTEKDLHSMFCKRSDCALCLGTKQSEVDIPDAADDNYLSDKPSDVYNIFCKRALCFYCRTGEESISVHTDCFELFEHHCTIGDGEDCSEQKYDKYRRLWVAGTRQYAWREMQPLKFPSSITLALPQPEMISRICGFRKIFLPEVIRLIQSHSKLHIIWRYCSAIQLAQELGSAKAEAASIYEVSKVLSWSRGSSPNLVQDESLAGSFIRFTIDHRGIRSIDRISDTPANITGEMPVSSCVFAVESVEKLSDANIKFELGLCRLQSPGELRISTWSTRNPLRFMQLMQLASPYSYHRLAAISLDPEQCTGLSFFMASQVVHDIYAHSRRSSTHLERFQYLRSMFDREIAWIYIPLTAQDQITAIEVRKNVTIDTPHLLTIWTKTGKFIVGTPQRVVKKWRAGHANVTRRPARGILYETEGDARRPLTLIHEIPSSGLMTFIGTDADKQTETTEAAVDPQRVWPLPHAFFSSASLEGVLHVHVFNDKLRNLCKGILFEYENGSKRTVGQCRLGWDRVQSWRRPLRIFYDSASYPIPNPTSVFHPDRHKSVRVTFDSESDHVSEDGTFEKNFYPMKGCLNFWFLVNDVEIEIVDP
ncbi:hypothetical protein GGI35DRAFT_431322 [Trichoderma velutinum]